MSLLQQAKILHKLRTSWQQTGLFSESL